MNDTAHIDPSKRQVFANLGNRFVVFGPEGALPEPVRFDPKDSPTLPRVADESEAAESRIVETLQVSGMTRVASHPQNGEGPDLELIDANGRHVFVELKVRERDPRDRDLDTGHKLLDQAAARGQDLEVWFFNIERLKLTVMRRDGANFRFHQLVPLNVWEKTQEGVYERQRVVEEVDHWIRRVDRLYADIEAWLGSDKSIRFERTRTITMSEEMMQQFAVTDREVPILDVVSECQTIASFVPRGLWLIGAWGRVDLITKDRTFILIALKKDGSFEWQLMPAGDRRFAKSLDKAVILGALSGA
jgi:hypothetical protein